MNLYYKCPKCGRVYYYSKYCNDCRKKIPDDCVVGYLDYSASHYKRHWKKYLTFFVIVALIGLLILFAVTPVGRGSGDGRITCGSCGRTFSSDSSNAKSVKSTGMCSNCYSNYKTAERMLE